MKVVVLLALGSRGDVQPMVALGKALQAAGKPVMVVALRNFAPLVEAAGLSFMPIDRSLDESLDAVPGSALKFAGGAWSYTRRASHPRSRCRPRSDQAGQAHR